MNSDDFTARLVGELLNARTGQQLTRDRHWRIDTVLSGLMRSHGIASAKQLAQRLLLPNSQDLAAAVVEALLNNETYFFRDRAMFDQLAVKILPDLAERRSASRRLSIWSAGCSTGQEALSLAMIFAEQRARWAGWRIEIVGTDISGKAIAAARKASYSAFQVQRGLGVKQMLDHFSETPEGWQANPALLQPVRFAVHNVLEPAPAPGTFDLILCRNVLLYFDSANRSRALDRLADALSPDGFLMLGGGESAAGLSQRLAPCSETSGFLRRADTQPARRAAGGR
ncbi:MAG TPA: protein-glutamate O-methyltransferase CheR [Novosphingobium sp.]|nr:protein-glutamate O-methyltransferase CheR [Novosphingobium sp.]